MNKFIKLFAMFLALVFLGIACSDDDKDENENKEELVGMYEYTDFKFNFKYKGDTIKITLPDLSSMLPGFDLPELPTIPTEGIAELVTGLTKQEL